MATGAAMVIAVAAVAAAIYWPATAPRALGAARVLAHQTVAAGPSQPALRSHQAGRPLTQSARRRAAQKPARTLKAQAPASLRVGMTGPKLSPTVKPKPKPPVYRNPLRSISGLIPERVDMGADFGGTGPIYAIGNAVITNATASNYGWPGGGWITYRLTSGPAAGLQVYVAEDVTPTVSVGQVVTSGTVIATMIAGSAGIETGWAMADGLSAESQLPEAGGISGNGPFPTLIGLNFDRLLQALGVPAAPNSGQSSYGVLPSSYPATWTGLTPRG